MIRDQELFDRMRPAGFDGVFDWDALIPAFAGSNIEPTDIDFITEHNGYYLVIETKHKDHHEIPLGQRILLEQLVATGRFVVIILKTKQPSSTKGWEWWTLKDLNEVIKQPFIGDYDDLLACVHNWYEWSKTRKTKIVKIVQMPAQQYERTTD